MSEDVSGCHCRGRNAAGRVQPLVRSSQKQDLVASRAGPGCNHPRDTPVHHLQLEMRPCSYSTRWHRTLGRFLSVLVWGFVCGFSFQNVTFALLYTRFLTSTILECVSLCCGPCPVHCRVHRLIPASAQYTSVAPL